MTVQESTQGKPIERMSEPLRLVYRVIARPIVKTSGSGSVLFKDDLKAEIRSRLRTVSLDHLTVSIAPAIEFVDEYDTEREDDDARTVDTEPDMPPPKEWIPGLSPHAVSFKRGEDLPERECPEITLSMDSDLFNFPISEQEAHMTHEAVRAIAAAWDAGLIHPDEARDVDPYATDLEESEGSVDSEDSDDSSVAQSENMSYEPEPQLHDVDVPACDCSYCCKRGDLVWTEIQSTPIGFSTPARQSVGSVEWPSPFTATQVFTVSGRKRGRSPSSVVTPLRVIRFG